MDKTKRTHKSPHAITIWQATERPPANAEIYRMSPQIREIPKNSTAIIAIAGGKKDYKFVLKKLLVQVYDQYAAQDLRTGVFVGSTTQVFSGKWDATAALVTDTPFRYPWWIEETKTTSSSGRPHSLLSKSGGKGFHDNGSPLFEDVYISVDENKSVYVKIENQSEFHDHAIEVSYQGWLFSPRYLEVFQ
ncbi:hypothetical protein [Candidatus Uabimicrobium sp. HlEnr_7]|uniref:hypothetical protein n=1 Tax=Candidatus Uabimicrobium helgolandensis TaxID=3095367 RepID=UPI00355830EE